MRGAAVLLLHGIKREIFVGFSVPSIHHMARKVDSIYQWTDTAGNHDIITSLLREHGADVKWASGPLLC